MKREQSCAEHNGAGGVYGATGRILSSLQRVRIPARDQDGPESPAEAVAFSMNRGPLGASVQAERAESGRDSRAMGRSSSSASGSSRAGASSPITSSCMC